MRTVDTAVVPLYVTVQNARKLVPSKPSRTPLSGSDDVTWTPNGSRDTPEVDTRDTTGDPSSWGSPPGWLYGPVATMYSPAPNAAPVARWVKIAGGPAPGAPTRVGLAASPWLTVPVVGVRTASGGEEQPTSSAAPSGKAKSDKKTVERGR